MKTRPLPTFLIAWPKPRLLTLRRIAKRCVSKGVPMSFRATGSSFETPFLTKWLLRMRARGILGSLLLATAVSQGLAAIGDDQRLGSAPADSDSIGAGSRTGDAAEPAPPAGNPLWAIPLRSLSATRERPLFSPSRRPPNPPVAPPPPPPPRQVVAPPPPPEKPTLVLLGTIVGEGESYAVFYEPAQRKTLRLKLGEADPKGWKLSSVDARTAILEKGNQSVMVSLPAVDAPPNPNRAPMMPPRPNDADL